MLQGAGQQTNQLIQQVTQQTGQIAQQMVQQVVQQTGQMAQQFIQQAVQQSQDSIKKVEETIQSSLDDVLGVESGENTRGILVRRRNAMKRRDHHEDLTTATCTRVLDGDTIEVNNSFVKNLHVRLCRVDTPEMKRGESDPDRLLHKHAALVAKNFVMEHVLGKQVTLVRSENNDKYGRYLAEVIVDGVNICDLLLTKKFAKQYVGEEKQPWSTLELQAIIDLPERFELEVV